MLPWRFQIAASGDARRAVKQKQRTVRRAAEERSHECGPSPARRVVECKGLWSNEFLSLLLSAAALVCAIAEARAMVASMGPRRSEVPHL